MLTPADIKHRSLKTTMGGYNKKDTDEFLASILESFEELSSENAKLKEKLTSLAVKEYNIIKILKITFKRHLY